MVEIFLLLRNARKFISDADSSAKAVGGIGTAAEKSGKQAGIGWKGIAKWAGGAAAIYGASRYIKSATDATTDLAKSTMAVQRVTSMDTQTASAWVSVLKERGVTSQQFSRSLVSVSKQMEIARNATVAQRDATQVLNKEWKTAQQIGGKQLPAAYVKYQHALQGVQAKGDKARATMKLLGVSTADIAKGNVQDVLLRVADSFKAMRNPAERATLVQKLFGRQGLALLPILMQGRKGVAAALATQVKYGNYLSGKGKNAARDFLRDQRELHAATEGLKVTLGTALMPAIVGVTGVIVKLVNVFQPLLRQGWLVKTLIGVLTVAFVAYKAAVIAATIASWGLSAATWASIGIWVAVVAAIIAVGVGIYVLYKKWHWFHNFVQASWAWIKKNWPLLLGIITGPFGLAAAYIITHWTKVKTFVMGVIDAIRNAVKKLLDVGRNAAHGVIKTLGKVPGAGLATGAYHKLFGGQHGGIVPYHSNVLVGERGPELLSLPQGSTVRPLPHAGQLAMPGGTGTVEITVPLYLNGRVLAQAVAQYSADKLARR